MSSLQRELSRIGRQIHSVCAPLITRLRWRHSKAFPASVKRHHLPHQLLISLTSYPPRFEKLHLTLKSLLTQSVKPDTVVLWIAEADMELLPQSVLKLQSQDFQIRSTRDLRSYKKIIPALEDYPDAFIVTADDDLYYRREWLAQMVDAQLTHPGHIVCHRVHQITQSDEKQWKAYRHWPKNWPVTGNSKSYFPTSGAGALYPPRSLSEKTSSVDDFLQLAPYADDVWLYWMARLAETEIYNLGTRGLLITWRGSQSSTLYKINVIDSQNDTQIAAMGRHFGYPSLE